MVSFLKDSRGLVTPLTQVTDQRLQRSCYKLQLINFGVLTTSHCLSTSAMRALNAVFHYSQLNEVWLPLCLQQVHKLVLLAASPYLQSTFRHANPTSHLEVNLPRDTGVGAARDFLKYIYQGVLHVAPETVNALRRIAAMLQIDQLLTYCDDYICRLTGTTAASLPHHSTLSHSTPQVCMHILQVLNCLYLPHNKTSELQA